MKRKYTVRKYDGDDIYSWAVFFSKDVKGKRGVIFHGQAKPLITGLGRSEATYYRDKFERENKNAK